MDTKLLWPESCKQGAHGNRARCAGMVKTWARREGGSELGGVHSGTRLLCVLLTVGQRISRSLAGRLRSRLPLGGEATRLAAD